MNTEELKHYGILGMKWGVRKDRSAAKADRQARRAEKKAARASRKDAKRDIKQHKYAKKKYLIRKNKENKAQITKKIVDKASQDEEYRKVFDKKYNKMEQKAARYDEMKRKQRINQILTVASTISAAVIAYKARESITKLPPSKSPKLLEAHNVLDMVLGDDGVYRLK